MKRYEVFPGHAGSPLQMAEFEPAALGDRQVAVAIKAVSLNYRDILVTQNTYFCPITDGLVPCSDGAGEVVAVGKDVRGLMVGDRVASLFFPNWQSGRAEIATLPKIARVIEPDAALTDAMDAGATRFRAAQSAIKDLT